MASTDPAPLRMTRDEFASLVTHELRNPLSAMSGWTHLLAADPALGSDGARRAIAGLRRALDQQLHLIDTLGRVLRLAGGTLEALEPVELGEVLEACADAMRGDAAGSGRTVTVERRAGVERAWRVGERAALLSALRSLGAYGLRHGLPGAPLLLELDGEAGAPTIRIGVDEGDGDGLSIWHGFSDGFARLPLELLLATLVLEAHGARVGPNGSGRAGDVLTIRFAPVPAGGIPSGVGGPSSPARPHE
jgi:signal transduction histidine kinase